MTTIGILIRAIRWRQLLDACVATLAGGLIAFMLGYTMFTTFNRIWYQAGLDYQAVRESDTPAVNGTNVLRAGSLFVIPEYLAPTGSGPRIYAGSTSPTLRVVPADSVPEMNRILARSLVSGELTTDGVVIDRAHAAVWGIGVGDRVAIAHPGNDDCVVSVSGVARPYESLGLEEAGDGGQIVLPDTLCAAARAEAVTDADPPAAWEIYNDGGSTKSQMIMSALLSPQNYAVAVLVVLAVGLLLWVLVSIRSSSRVARAAADDAMSLVRLGVAPRRLRRTAWLFSMLSVVLGAAGALAIARFAMLEIAGFYAQPALLLLIGLLLALVGGIAQRLKLRGWPTRNIGLKE